MDMAAELSEQRADPLSVAGYLADPARAGRVVRQRVGQPGQMVGGSPGAAGDLHSGGLELAAVGGLRLLCLVGEPDRVLDGGCQRRLGGSGRFDEIAGPAL